MEKQNLLYEPLDILKQLNEDYGSEMANYDMAFICGLIKEYRPKKILELGVAAGGTTAVVMNCCKNLNLDSEIYSVDLAQNYYRDTSKKTGYLAEITAELLPFSKFQLYRGDIYLAFAEQIGNDIDMVIIDTVHSLPGELLDFISCFPYMKEGTVVILHDILLNHLSVRKEQFATKVLLDVVVGKKIIGINEDNIGNYPNIGAFVVNEDTKKYITDVFSALTINWSYVPSKDQIDKYIDFIKKHYSNEQLLLFTSALEINEISINQNKEKKMIKMVDTINFLQKLKNKEIFIYGFGKYGKLAYNFLSQIDMNIKGFVVSDNQIISLDDARIPVKHLSEVSSLKNTDDVEIVVAVAEFNRKMIMNELSKQNFNSITMLDDEFFSLFI